MHDTVPQKAQNEQYVLDTSAIYNATNYPPNMVLYSTPGVLNELHRVYKEQRAMLFVAARLNIVSPRKSSREAVDRAARKTGDISRLSPVDREVLAASYELDAVLVTDDYSMQNTANALGIRFTSLHLPRIKNVREWVLKCRGCGAKYEDSTLLECRVCGGKLVTSTRTAKDLDHGE
ncbi:MAG: hypothetical protein QXP70_02870 [Methanomassiliicoccales archaeon]